MTNAAESVQTKTLLDNRAHSLTHRILTGAGTCAIIAFEAAEQPHLHSVAHGLASDGTLLVAANVAVDDVDDAFRGDEPLEVRLDFLKESPAFDVRIISATTHLLGTLEWLTLAEADFAFRDVLLPAHLVELAAQPGGRLGIVHSDRVVTHTSNGITAMPFGEIAARHRTCDALFARRVDDVAAELTFAADDDLLGMYAAAFIEGWFGGITLSRRETTEPCVPVVGRTFVVDVDQSGLTLMHVGDDDTTIVFAPFDEAARSESELRADLKALLDLDLSASE
jgi:hypothetical protein